MTAIEQIQMAQQAKLFHADGKPATLKLCPALEPNRIDALEEEVGQPLPDELRALLAFCSGFDRCFGGIDFDFTGEGMFFGFERGFPAGLPIAADGAGISGFSTSRRRRGWLHPYSSPVTTLRSFCTRVPIWLRSFPKSFACTLRPTNPL